MKKIMISILPLIISVAAHAGNGGGTMQPLSLYLKDSPEIVYHMGEQDGVVRFAYGALVGDQWQIQKISGRLDYLTKKTDLITSLEESKDTHEWVQVK